VSFSRPIAARGGDRAGMLWACEAELIAKLIHRARQARWGLNITLAEKLNEFGYQKLSKVHAIRAWFTGESVW
jgi:hypothetical protein